MNPEQNGGRDKVLAEYALLRIAVEKLPLGLSMFDENDKLLLANKQYGQIWGLPEAVTQAGTSFSEIMEHTFGHETTESKSQVKPPPGAAVRRREWKMDDGRQVEVVVTRMADGLTISLHEDVTEQKNTEAKISYLAAHDQLTGLPNRSAMSDRIKECLQRNERGEDMAVLCLNLDRFKLVNESFGHNVGDMLLCQAAERLRKCSRKTDYLVRSSGDEFIIIQCGTPQPASSSGLSRRLIEVLAEPFDLDGHLAQIGVSVGIVVAPNDGKDASELLKNAHLALTRAKHSGRNSYCFFEHEMDARIQARGMLESDLRAAQKRSELALVFQPLLDLKQKRITAFETLLRWHHSSRGSISPADFIPIAEESGLIIPIGKWVLSQACKLASQWPADIRVSVNLSAMQLTHASLIEDVQSALAEAGIDATRLEIEITESVMMSDPKQAMVQLRALSNLGVSLAIDDFGTGYSSLSYLHSYPFDRIKIDRSFIRELENKPEVLTILSAMVNLGRNLDLAVTVEGVENEQQMDAVRETGACEVQGFLFSKPLAAEKALGLLSTLKI